MKEVKRVAKIGETVKMLTDYYVFHKGQELKCIKECSDNVSYFTDGINNGYLSKERYVVLEKEEEKEMKLKVGDFVKTRCGIGEILYKEKDGYVVGIKGFDGHDASSVLPREFVEKKGYLGQCWHCNKDNVEKIEDPSLLINEEFDEPKEMVNHPSHYNQGKREVIEEMRILFGDEAVESFCRLNAYKYLRRAEFKGNKKEDLDKAEWYMDYLEMMRGEE